MPWYNADFMCLAAMGGFIACGGCMMCSCPGLGVYHLGANWSHNLRLACRLETATESSLDHRVEQDLSLVACVYRDELRLLVCETWLL